MADTSPRQLAEKLPTPVERPTSRTDRVGQILSTLRGDLRTLESKVDALQSRNDRVLQASAAPPSSGHLDEIQASLDALTAQLNQERQNHSQLSERIGQIDAHACGLGAMNESIVSRIENLAKDLSQAREREASLSDLAQQMQAQLSGITASVEQIRSEINSQVNHLHREVSGRMVGLYLIGCIALTVAVATLIIALTGGRP